MLLRFAHEMHDHPEYPWAVGNNGNTASDYVAAYRYVHAIFERFHADNVQWVWNPNTLGDAAPATYVATYQSVYPGDDVVDWIGLDIFNTVPTWTGADRAGRRSPRPLPRRMRRLRRFRTSR